MEHVWLCDHFLQIIISATFRLQASSSTLPVNAFKSRRDALHLETVRPCRHLMRIRRSSAIAFRKRSAWLLEQPVDIHFILSADKHHAVRDGRNGKLHCASRLIALLVLV